jgi:hypothetical protein
MRGYALRLRLCRHVLQETKAHQSQLGFMAHRHGAETHPTAERCRRCVGPHLDRAVQLECVILALREVAVAQVVAAEGAVLEPAGWLSDQSGDRR